MPLRPPKTTDFPPSLTISITPPPPPPSTTTTNSQRAPPNILLLLHGLGDTSNSFKSLAQSLRLPETTILTIQAPHPLPLDIPGFHWGDDIQFDSRTGSLDMDTGFKRATDLLLRDVVGDVLVGKCGYRLREIMLLGFGQGGMFGLVLALGIVSFSFEGLRSSSNRDLVGEGEGERELAGVVSIGAAVPLSLSGSGSGAGRRKSRTPVLVVSGRDSEVVTESAVKRTRDVFEFVEVHTYGRRGDTMPRSRDEMMPVMRFFARRLRSYQGVPEGSVELS